MKDTPDKWEPGKAYKSEIDELLLENATLKAQLEEARLKEVSGLNLEEDSYYWIIPRKGKLSPQILKCVPSFSPVFGLGFLQVSFSELDGIYRFFGPIPMPEGIGEGS